MKPALPAYGGLQSPATSSDKQPERPQTADVADAHAAPPAGVESRAGQQEPESASRAAAEDAAPPQLSSQPMQPADAPHAAASWGLAAAEDTHLAATEDSPGADVTAAVPPAANATEQLSAGREASHATVRSSDDGGSSTASETDATAQAIAAAPQQLEHVAPAGPGTAADALLSARGEDRPSGPAGDTPSSESRTANSFAVSSGG